MTRPLLVPLYSRLDPYEPWGWCCCAPLTFEKDESLQHYCFRVTRTRRGMISHLKLKHGIKLQGELFNEHIGSETTPAR